MIFQTLLACADRAIDLFSELGDRAGKAFAIDTKARICIAEKDFNDAPDLADEAIKIFSVGDNAGMLQEVYLTKAHAFVGLGKIADSIIASSEAIELAKVSGAASNSKNR